MKTIQILTLCLALAILFALGWLIYTVAETSARINDSLETGNNILSRLSTANDDRKGEMSAVIHDPGLTLSTSFCSGEARCFLAKVERVVDGDTIHVLSNNKIEMIRFSLTSAAEPDLPGSEVSTAFVLEHCPIGSAILIDEDDKQIAGSYDRIVGLVICGGGININKALLDTGLGWIDVRFCQSSEFAKRSWAKKYGCQ